MRFRVWGLGFTVYGLEFRICGVMTHDQDYDNDDHDDQGC